MKRLLQDLGLILALAGLWAVGGYVLGVTIEAMGIPYPPLKIILASLNVIIGMMLFKGITRDPTAEHIFFSRPGIEDEGDVRIGCLWLMPVSILFFSLLIWFWAVILRLILSK